MITIQKVETLSDADYDTLYDASAPYLESGSYPWEFQPIMNTPERRKTRFRELLDAALNQAPKGGVVVWGVYIDDEIHMFNVSYKEEDTYVWALSLLKPDSNGSRAYLYSEEFSQARTDFWKELGLTRWIVECCGQGTPIYEYQQQAKTSGSIQEDVVESPKVVAGVTLARFEYTLN